MQHRVLLVSPPWRLAGWPSLALGALKAHLAQHQVYADALHLHLDVAVRLGWDRYEDIASGWELPEAIYFALHAPGQADDILSRSAASMRASGQHDHAALAHRALVAEVETATSEALHELDLQQYDVVGFSVGALQLGASVYLSYEFKKQRPALKIVFGGSSVVGAAGERLLGLLPWVDALIDGEGEGALAALALADEWTTTRLERIPNLHYRNTDGTVVRSATDVTPLLDMLAVPDFTEFFAAARSAGLTSNDLVLPVEASRGCKWEHRKSDGKLRGCSFCGLYRNSPNYREHGFDSVMGRIREGVHNSRTVQLSFVDAYLPPAYAKQLLQELAKDSRDLTLFCEMRCDLDEDTARLLAEAGARHVQLGVEAFDTRLLAMMSKGTRLIDNISSIKLCEEFGVPYQFNLITHFPGASTQSLLNSIEILPCLFGFRPPSMAPFYLDRGSRMYNDPARYGIEIDSLDRTPVPFLPAALMDARVCQVVPFSASIPHEVEVAWTEIERCVVAWQDLHRRARAEGATQLLTWRDSGSALTITDLRGEEALTFEVDGIIRNVMLASDRLVNRRVLLQKFAALDAASLDSIIERLSELRLVVQEGQWVIGLPVRARLPCGAPRRSLRDNKLSQTSAVALRLVTA